MRNWCVCCLIGICLVSNAYADVKDLIQDGIKGGAAGAVGSQIENPLIAGAAGAGTGIAAGAIMDTLWKDPAKEVVEKEVVYVEKPAPEPTQTVQPNYSPKRKSREYMRGYDDGYEVGYKDAMSEVVSYCGEKI